MSDDVHSAHINIENAASGMNNPALSYNSSAFCLDSLSDILNVSNALNSTEQIH